VHLKNEHQALIARCIADLEQVSQAEIVVVVRLRSGSYRDCDYLFGFTLALFGLAALLFVPWEFHPASFFVPLILLFFIGNRVSQKLGLFRWLTSKKRRHQQVRQAAIQTFFDKCITKTTRHTGLLLYLSMQEHRAELLGDTGVEAALPKERLEHLRQLMDQTTYGKKKGLRIAEGLRTLSIELARVLPATDQVNELQDGVDVDADGIEGGADADLS